MAQRNHKPISENWSAHSQYLWNCRLPTLKLLSAICWPSILMRPNSMVLNHFFTSLLDLIEVKQPGLTRNALKQNFCWKEVSTKNGLFIDLLLSSIIENEEDDSKINEEDPDSWSIIIENKIDASLYNDLNEYYESTNGKNKIGVVLSLRDESTTISTKTQEPFVSITHKELIERVKLNLPEFYFDSNDRHLLMLKEYMSNIDSLYGNPQYSTNMDKTLKLFQEHGEKIKDLKKKDKELQTYLNKSVDTAMESFGLYTKVRKQAASKHYYFREEENITNTNIHSGFGLTLPNWNTKTHFWDILSCLENLKQHTEPKYLIPLKAKRYSRMK